MTAWLRREPVLNRYGAPVATRVRLHGASDDEIQAALASLADAWPNTGTLIVGVTGTDTALALRNWQPPENLLIEFPTTQLAADTSCAELARRFEQSGHALCLAEFAATPAAAHVRRYRYVFSSQADAEASAMAPGPLYATGIAGADDFAAALDAGCGGAVGWFFLDASPPENTRLNPGQARIIRVLNLVRRNAAVPEVEEALKQDLGISFKLLRYINSAGFGMTRRVESFRHAVTLVGYDKLNKWLSLLLVTASSDPAAAALMQTAIARGRFMELAARGHADTGLIDNLFVAGSFSLLDLLLGVRIDAILAEMQLPDAIAAALIAGTGPCAPWLALARACERGDTAELAAHAAALGLDAATVNRAQLAAQAFADSLEID